jgi:riboflavin kinase/FMN adenylyltransferase
MRVIRHLPRLAAPLPRVVLTLGNFDGVHRGHQAIVAQARSAADRRSAQVVALTFHPHPMMVLAAERGPALIQSLHDRLAILRTLGVDVAVVQRFTRAFAGLSPEAFVEEFLLRSLDLVHVVVGYNVNFGRARAGSAETLRALGARHGFAVETVGPVTVGDVAVSSSIIREAVASGDVVRAGALLGRPYRLRGRVVVGDRRGRTIGFPTANLHVRPRVLLPADGVYAARALDGATVHAGVVNVGVRPTFGESRRTVEAYLFDFEGDLYGRWLELDFVARVRGEQRFAGVAALKAAIASDVAHARRILAGSVTPGRS